MNLIIHARHMLVGFVFRAITPCVARGFACWCLVILGVLAAACEASIPHPATKEKPVALPHHDEPEHEARPSRVRLSAEVVRDAKVETQPVGKHVISPTMSLAGSIMVAPDHQARLSARLDGVVERTLKQPGDAVQRGDAIAVIRAPNLQTLRAAESALRAKAHSARANAERLASLVETRMASRQEAMTAEAEAEALQSEANAARERLRAIGIAPAKSARREVLFDVRTPIAGVLIERPVIAGDPVDASTVIGTVVTLEHVWFVAHVFERDIGRVRTGARASITLNAYPNETFTGTVEYISHETDPGARTLSARIPLTNRDGKLRLGLFGTAHVVVDEPRPEQPTLAVPTSAVTVVYETPAVFVRHDDGHFELHDVQLGRTDNRHVEVLHGLREGEHVVVEGVFTVKSVLLRSSIQEEH